LLHFIWQLEELLLNRIPYNDLATHSMAIRDAWWVVNPHRNRSLPWQAMPNLLLFV